MNPTQYTFNVCGKFEMQYTFAASDVIQNSDDESDVEPKTSALSALRGQLAAILNHSYGIADVEVFISHLIASEED